MSPDDFTDIEDCLGYTFISRNVLIEALTHKSFSHEHPETDLPHNERLEFLGDSVLGLVIVEHLFLLDIRFRESVMAKIKSYLVKESVLFEIANSFSLGKYLRLGKGEELTGGRTKKSILADTLEALLGAIYLDGGYSRVRDIILNLFRERIDAVLSSGELQDFKTELQEKTQVHFGTLPEYRIIRQEGEDHLKVFTVEVFIKGIRYGAGSGKSKKEAERVAAREALAGLPNPGVSFERR